MAMAIATGQNGMMMNNVQLDVVYNGDSQSFMQNLNGIKFCVVTDPPYNVGYHYNEYSDNLDEYDYLSLLRFIIGKNPAVIIHYSESINKLSIALNRAPERCVSWVYNSNTPRQHREIAFYGIKPDFTKVSQPYKNLNDKRIQARIEAGKTCEMYDWFEEDQIKNVEKEKLNINHPCVIPYGVMDRIIKMIPEDYVIVDPFCGTGTTLVAAKKNNRHFIGIEKNAEYCTLAERRLNEETCQTEIFA